MHCSVSIPKLISAEFEVVTYICDIMPEQNGIIISQSDIQTLRLDVYMVHANELKVNPYSSPMEASTPLTKEEEQMHNIPNPDANIEPSTGLDINPSFGQPDHPLELKRLIAILLKYKGVFSDSLNGSTLNIPPLEIPEEAISAFHGAPLRNRYSQAKKLTIETWIAKMIKDKLIEKSKSKTLSPLVVASTHKPSI